MDRRTLTEHAHYKIMQSTDGSELFFEWHAVPDISIVDFKSGVAEYARQCEVHRPARAVIDATQLAPQSPAVRWASRQTFDNQEDYMPWWAREIVPAYNNAGIARLAVATGNPNSPGELREPPPGANFRMGYFKDVSDAERWIS